jgi:acyl transferase domain-containing protein
VGIVVLKPLAQALADGDAIAAVIRGSALGNDGSDKMSYWATNPQGQSAVMQQAFRQAGVDPESLGFVEAHGTATHLGDMIETYALRRAFATERRGLVRPGSVKTNIGHLDAAAGIGRADQNGADAAAPDVVSDAPLARGPNPRIDFANGPFYVNTEVRPWKAAPANGRRSIRWGWGTNALCGGRRRHLLQLPRYRAAVERPLPASHPVRAQTPQRWQRCVSGWQRLV